MSALAQAAKSLLLIEFVKAFFLSMRQFVAPKPTLNYPFEKGRSARASGGSTRCVAIPTARSAASPASSARRSVPAQAITIEAGPRRNDGRVARSATTSTW